MPSNHLILCHPLLLLPSIFPSIRVFSNESVLRIRWPKLWNFSFSISPSNEYSGLISFRMDWLNLLAVQRTLKSLLQHHSSKTSVLQLSAFFIVQFSYLYLTTGKTIALTRQTFVGKTNWFVWKDRCWERLSAGGEGDDRGWDGWMASPTQSMDMSLSKLRELVMNRRPGLLQSMGLQRVRHDWVTELNWTKRKLPQNDFHTNKRWNMDDKNAYGICGWILDVSESWLYPCDSPTGFL